MTQTLKNYQKILKRKIGDGCRKLHLAEVATWEYIKCTPFQQPPSTLVHHTYYTLHPSISGISSSCPLPNYSNTAALFIPHSHREMSVFFRVSTYILVHPFNIMSQDAIILTMFYLFSSLCVVLQPHVVFIALFVQCSNFKKKYMLGQSITDSKFWVVLSVFYSHYTRVFSLVNIFFCPLTLNKHQSSSSQPSHCCGPLKQSLRLR